MIVTLFDYGAGNLHSLAKAIALGGAEARVATDPVAALATDVLVLPGVGAFGAAAAALAPGRERMRDALMAGLPCVAICLGMQLLFEASDEGPGEGLGLIAGRVRALRAERVPHMGWNGLDWAGAGASGAARPALAPLEVAYYAHSFVCAPADERVVAAWTTHERDRFPAAVRVANTLGAQFHPEKSSAEGVAFVASALAAVATGARS